MINKHLFYIRSFIFSVPCTLFHEFCHWIFYAITFFLGLNTFPEIVIKRWPTYCINEDDSTCTSNCAAFVRYGTRNVLVARIGAFMPVIGIILLFLFSSWYMDIIYFTQINELWLSPSDWRYASGKDPVLQQMRLRNSLNKRL